MIYKKAKIISGFPGIGKTYLAKNNTTTMSDSDSSRFSWLKNGDRNPKFPKNYIEHILSIQNYFNYIFVSSHKLVRQALQDRKINFILVYPRITLKTEYLTRFRKRGSPESFLNLLEKNWDSWILECENQKGCGKIVMCSNQYLSEILPVHHG